MAERDLPPVPIQSPMILDTGIASQPWAAWFRQIFNRVGGHQALTNVELESEFTTPNATQFTIANNRSTFTDITGLIFSGTSTRSFELDVQIYRNSNLEELSARVKILGTYKTTAASWDFALMGGSGDDVQDFGLGGLIFNVTASGQVQYKSHNQTGAITTQKIRYTYTTTGVET